MYRVMFDFRNKKINEITSSDLKANFMACLILNKRNEKNFYYLVSVSNSQIDKL